MLKAAFVTSFNEAEAIKPRNHEGKVTDEGVWFCFNEAEAIKPRNPTARKQGINAHVALQ